MSFKNIESGNNPEDQKSEDRLALFKEAMRGTSHKRTFPNSLARAGSLSGIYKDKIIPDKRSQNEVDLPVEGLQSVFVSDAKIRLLNKKDTPSIIISAGKGKTPYTNGQKILLQPSELDPVEVEIVKIEENGSRFNLTVKKI